MVAVISSVSQSNSQIHIFFYHFTDLYLLHQLAEVFLFPVYDLLQHMLFFPTNRKLILTLSLPNKLLSAQFLVPFNFISASMSLKVGKNVVWVTNSFDPDETPSYSESNTDPSCLNMALWLWLAGLGLRYIPKHCRHSLRKYCHAQYVNTGTRSGFNL